MYYSSVLRKGSILGQYSLSMSKPFHMPLCSGPSVHATDDFPPQRARCPYAFALSIAYITILVIHRLVHIIPSWVLSHPHHNWQIVDSVSNTLKVPHGHLQPPAVHLHCWNSFTPLLPRRLSHTGLEPVTRGSAAALPLS